MTSSRCQSSCFSRNKATLCVTCEYWILNNVETLCLLFNVRLAIYVGHVKCELLHINWWPLVASADRYTVSLTHWGSDQWKCAFWSVQDSQFYKSDIFQFTSLSTAVIYRTIYHNCGKICTKYVIEHTLNFCFWIVRSQSHDKKIPLIDDAELPEEQPTPQCNEKVMIVMTSFKLDLNKVSAMWLLVLSVKINLSYLQ